MADQVLQMLTLTLYDATAYYWQLRLLRKKAIFKQYKFFSHCCRNSLFSKNIIYKCVHFNTKRFSFFFHGTLERAFVAFTLEMTHTHIIHHFSQKLIQVIMFFHLNYESSISTFSIFRRVMQSNCFFRIWQII